MIAIYKGLKVSYGTNRYLKQVLKDEEYRFVSYYPTIVDVGANIGTFSLYMYNNADRIFALEPVEENLNHLRKTIDMNNLTKITPLQMAISDKSFIQTMAEAGDPGMGGWRLSETGTYPVDTRTLLDFMDSQGIDYVDLLKLDVEGEELKIVSSKLFPYKRIGTIIGEYHEHYIREELEKILEWMGYRYFDLGSNHFLARR